MNENFDDPKLTAYALGELEGKERAEVEAFLSSNPEACRWVEEVRKTAMRLEGDLCAGASPQLNSEQLGAVASRQAGEIRQLAKRHVHAERARAAAPPFDPIGE